MTQIYLDVCCLNRPFDNQIHDRIHLESEAIILILTHIQAGQWEWVSSDVVDYEIEKTPNDDRKRCVKLLTKLVTRTIPLGQIEIERARQLEEMGIKAIDALHLACAENSTAGVLLTTDDGFLKIAKRYKNQVNIRVENPLTWLDEVISK